MNNSFDFHLEPGKKLQKEDYTFSKKEISVIIPFYNDGKYIEQSVNCILNQTFPAYELLIIDDGSKDKESLKTLDRISELDDRIKVFHKENEGLAATRDFGASQASSETKYLMFLDSDDLLDKTFLECAYWTLETNKDAAWAYSDSVGFECQNYLWNKWFDSKRLKKVNDLVSAAMIRKSAFYEVNGYELREKSVNEDWNFWLKLVSSGHYPVHMSYYGEWYRRKQIGELAKSRENKKRSLEIIKKTASKVKQRVEAIQYPKYDKVENILENKIELNIVNQHSKKMNVLMIIPWMITGGADIFNLELLKRLDKEKYNVILISSLPKNNTLRQEFEKVATVYDLTTFLDQKHWISFINYIIKKENINLIFNTNSTFGYAIIPYLKNKYANIPIIDYVHMEEWYFHDGGFARYSSENEQYIDKTFVCNGGTHKVLIDYFKRKKEEIETVYIGVDPQKYDPQKYNEKEILKKYNINKENRKIISYICRVTSQKRPFLLLEIMKKVLEKRNDILFLIVGDGDLLPELKKKVKSSNIQDSVLFLGNIMNTSEIYKISDITINCSIKEGLALTSYESLAMGVPVISADVGGQKELINEEVGAIVPCLQKETEINNYQYTTEEINNYVVAIENVIENLDKYKKECRQRVEEHFTLDMMAEKLSKEFEKITKNSNKGKEKNGKSSPKKEITRNVIKYFEENESVQKYLAREYQLDMYGRYCTDWNGKSVYNTKTEAIKEKLWKFPMWKKITQTAIWKKIVTKIKNRK